MVEVQMSGQTIIDNVPVRLSASTAGVVKIILPLGSQVHIERKTDDGEWSYDGTNAGWMQTNYLYLINDEDEEKFSTMTPEEQKAETERLEQERLEAEKKAQELRQQSEELEKQFQEIEKYLNGVIVDDEKIIDSLIVKNLNGVYGIPYQFLESVDPRLPATGSNVGRKYAEKIISKMPLLCITPGKVQFMSNFSKSEQKGVLAALLTGGTETAINNIITENGRYFTFAFDYAGYFEYVNGMCHAGARFLDIQDETLDIGGTQGTAADFDWANALNKNLKATFTSQEFIGFYMDSTDSVSESFTNETTQSQLSSTLDGFSELAREVGFLFGAGAGKQIQVMDESKLQTTLDQIDELADRYLNGSTLISNIGKNFATIAVGGKLLFPEIWADSQFSRSFDITIKLRTPDADVLSWYLNIYVPLCHLVALAAGHQTDNPNGYYSPFLVRAFYKGLFNVDMGIVTDMSITKGKEAAWNIDGLPTEIDVNMTIKDLYGMLSICPGDEPKNFVNNNIMMDYIANTCGININEMDLMRSLEIYYILAKNKTKNLPNRIMRKFQDVIDTYAMNFYQNFTRKFLI